MYSDERLDFTHSHLNEQEKVSEKETKIAAKITTYLRWIGSILIILSAVSFMLQGHQELQPAYRYWVGLGLTLMLCGSGFICAYLLKETKGARVFFGLATAFVFVQVSQVGAMIYGYWHGHAALQPEYEWLQFMDVNPTVIVIDLLMTVLVFGAVSYMGYSILARKYRSKLIIASVVGGLALLMPVRSGLMMACLLIGLYYWARKNELDLLGDETMRLPEGLAARALASFPLWIILGRSLLHPLGFTMAMTVSIMLTVFFIHDIKNYTQRLSILYLSQWIGTLSAIAIWASVVNEYALNQYHSGLAWLPTAAIIFALSTQVTFHGRLYRLLSSLAVVAICYYVLFEQAMNSAAVLTIAAGILLVLAGLHYQEKAPFFSGNICVMVGLLGYWEYLVNAYSTAPWLSSVGLGLVVILLASYIENKQLQIKNKSLYYFQQLKQWH